MSADQNIVIDIEARTEMAQQRIAAMGQLFKGQTAAMTKSLQGVQEQIQALGKQQGFNMPGVKKSSDVMKNHMNPALDKAQTKINQTSGLAEQARNKFKNMGDSGKKAGNDMMEAFDGAAMGLMFFGMQLQRVFGGIMRTSVSTFQDVHSQLENTTTQTDRLSGAWKFLKFNIGEALQPVMGFLTPIVANVAELVDRFPGVTRKIIVLGTVLGGLLTAGGALRLAQLAFKDMAGRISNMPGQLSKLSGKMKALSGLGAAISVGLTIQSFSDALDEWEKGDHGDAIRTAIKGIAQGTAGLLFALGRPGLGAAMLAASFTLDFLMSEGTNKKIKAFGRAVSAFFKTVAQESAKFFQRDFFDQINEAFLDFSEGVMSFMLRSSAVMSGEDPFSKDLQDKIDKVNKQFREDFTFSQDVPLKDDPNALEDFNFSKRFEENLDEITPDRTVGEKELNRALDPEDKKALQDIRDNTRLSREVLTRFFDTPPNKQVRTNPNSGNLEIINKTASRNS